MKKILFILITLSLLILTGCTNGALFIDANSTSDCTLKCYDLLDKYWCNKGSAMFESSNLNNNVNKQECECLMLDCIKDFRN